jgi:membrane protein
MRMTERMTKREPVRAPAAAVQFFKTLLAEYQRDQCLARAGGLAFATLLALVPLLALMFSLFSALGSFSGLLERFEAFLLTQLVPASQEEIMAYVQRFVRNSRALGVAGLLFFLATAVFLLNAVQNSFNAVWGSRPRRNSLHRLATFASILIVGSFLLSIGLNLFGVARSLVGGPAVAELGRSLSFLTAVAPSVFIFLALLLMIALLPSGRVRFGSALVGAAAGLVLWELARRLFFLWITYVLRMSVMYGSLAAVPIFLIWLYVAWSVVLLALEIAYLHQHRPLRLGCSPFWPPCGCSPRWGTPWACFTRACRSTAPWRPAQRPRGLAPRPRAPAQRPRGLATCAGCGCRTRESCSDWPTAFCTPAWPGAR